MSNVAQVRAAILAKLQGVTGIGKAHDYERFSRTEKEFQDLYKDTADNRIRGWNFYREATSERDLDNGSVRRGQTRPGLATSSQAASTRRRRSCDARVRAVGLRGRRSLASAARRERSRARAAARFCA